MSFTATGQTITLDSANEFVGGVNASGSQITLRDATALDLGTVSVTGDLSVTAGGAISDSGVMTVGGASSFTATGQTVTLDSANDFVGGVNASGAQITLRDTTALDLGTVSATGNLSVTAGGAISDSGVLTVGGASNLSATGQSITLDSANDFVGAINASGSQIRLRDTTALDLGTVSATGNLTVTAGGAISDSGVLTVGGASSFTAAGQSITLDSTNDFVGSVTTTSERLVINDVNAIDLSTVTLTGNLTVTAGGAISDSGVLTVGGASNFTAAGQTIALDSANDFVGTLNASGSQVTLRDTSALDLGTVTATGSLKLAAVGALTNAGMIRAARVEASASGGSISLNMGNDPLEGVRVSAQADLTLRTSGSLTLTPYSRLESKTGGIRVIVSDDLVAYGTTLIGKSALIEVGGSIKGQLVEKPEPIAFDGDLVLKAQAGIGGFGFDRVFVMPSSVGASISAVNGARGDVVLAAPDGLAISSTGVRSDSNGLVVLLTDAGTIQESGSVSAGSGRVVRLTGTTWISRPDAMATSLLVDLIGSDASPLSETPSPLARMNQGLRAGVRTALSDPLGEGRLSVTEAAPLTASAENALTERSPSATSSVGASTLPSPIPGAINTHQLLEAAMRFSQQGRTPTVQDTESLSGWVNRIDREAPPPAPPSERTPSGTDSPPASTVPGEPSPQPLRDVQTVPSRTPSESRRPPIESEHDSAESATGVRWLMPIGTVASWGPLLAEADPKSGQVEWVNASRTPPAPNEPPAPN